MNFQSTKFSEFKGVILICGPLTGRVQRKKMKNAYNDKNQSNRVQYFLSISDENYFVSNKFGSEIYVSDFMTLIPGNWLNDEIINFWIHFMIFFRFLLRNKYKEKVFNV